MRMRALESLSLGGLMVLLVACTPPAPADPDCACKGGDAASCPGADMVGTPDAVPLDADVVPPEDGEDGVGPDGDGGGPDVADAGCPQEHPCQETGVCAAGVPRTCVAGSWVCQYEAVAGYEFGGEVTCDGQDNDCDGQTDEALPVPAQCAQAGVCAAAMPQCGGESGWDCGLAGVAEYEADEVSYDGLDNDCDGETDEGLVKVCDPGRRRCAGTGFEECEPTATAWGAEESCGEGLACMGPGECTTPEAWRVNEVNSEKQQAPDAAVVGDHIVVAWHSNSQDGNNLGVFYKVFDRAGEEVVGETQANVFVQGDQRNPKVVGLGEDTFFVGWESSGQDGTLSSLFGNTIVVGGEASDDLALTQQKGAEQFWPAFGALPNGGAAVVWYDTGDGDKVKAGAVGPNGWPLGWEKVVAEPVGGKLLEPAIVALDDDEMAVFWQYLGASERDVRGRVVSNYSGAWMLGNEVDVAAVEDVDETRPVVAKSGETLLVGWLTLGGAPEACVQALDFGLAPIGEASCVAQEGDAFGITVCGDELSFVVMWQDKPSTSYALKLARYTPGAGWGETLTLGEGTFGSDGRFSVTCLGGGKVLATWAEQGPDDFDIWAQFVQVD